MDYIEEFKLMAISYAPKVIGAILVLLIGFKVINWLSSKLDRALLKSKADESLSPFLKSVLSVGLKIVLLLAVASMFGIETTSFVAIFGAMAFAIGMALQGSLGNFASGVLLLIFKPYKVGDLIEIAGGKIGEVKEIQIFCTILKTLDNKHIIVPNSLAMGDVITNISGQGEVGVELTFGIGYSDSIDKARDIILKIGKECPFVLDEPAQMVVVAELADSSVNLDTRPFVKSENYWDALFYMQENVKKAFDAAGVGIPFPQMDVHLHKEN